MYAEERVFSLTLLIPRLLLSIPPHILSLSPSLPSTLLHHCTQRAITMDIRQATVSRQGSLPSLIPMDLH